METWFASPERDSNDVLNIEIENTANNPLVDGVLHAVSGLVAVLNEHRQIVALNHSFLDMLGIKDPHKVLGLRPGEAIGCIHAHEMEGGCGTSQYCSTCGAAIAIVTSLRDNIPQERICAATVEHDGEQKDICLRVRAFPILIDGRKFLLLFIQDVTQQQQWMAMERVFFHDITNLLTGLIGASELQLTMAGQDEDLNRKVFSLSKRLAQEMEIQRCLSRVGSNYQAYKQKNSIRSIFSELETVFCEHPAVGGKELVIETCSPDFEIYCDVSLLLRVLGNMITNALEASDAGDRVRVYVLRGKKDISFHVWNRQVIAEDVGRRIFQKHYSTKGTIGRGLGTYSMKLLGEQFMGGTVSFVSNEDKGTIFTLSLPDSLLK